MHIIIVGCGRVGSELAKILSAEGHDIVIIDKNPNAFKRLGSSFNGITITGIGFDPEILKRAGVERAQALISVTNGDNSNVMTGQIAKKIFNVPKVITRIYDPSRAHIYRRFGLDTICTTIIGAKIIKDAVLQKEETHEVPLGKDKILIEFKLKKEEK
jgi:trk system potassium uptake protein TrkA